MDKQTESRERFEKMFKSEWHPDKTGPYAKDSMWFAWQSAWQAARDSLVVELPKQETYDDPLSAHDAIQDCAKAIRAIGIRIKGEGV